MFAYLGYIFVTCVLIYAVPSALYLMGLTISYFFASEKNYCKIKQFYRFAIIIPAYNEELLIGRLIKSLLEINYDASLRQIIVVADNCTDRTGEISAKYPVQVLKREDRTRIGKGYALNWAFEKIRLDEYDAVLIIDADNTVNIEILQELNRLLNNGELVIQCCNNVGNREDSWITELLYVSRTVSNKLYHYSKYKLGLSSYLMGNGICLKKEIIKSIGWKAFTQGEDWEYTAELIKNKIKIAFAVKAKVFHQESQNLKQARSQRIRWASGKFKIIQKHGIPIFLYAIKNNEWRMLDAVLPIIFPNFSLNVNLLLCSFILCLGLPTTGYGIFLIVITLGSIVGLITVFTIGAIIAGNYKKTLKASVMAPVFLIWKLVIDTLSIAGIYKNKNWIRTERHKPKTNGKK